jgi:protein-tyrosine phosphatase
MQEALESIEKENGREMIYAFLENAEYVIKGQMCFKEPPERVKRKKILGIF